jgi:hypothetical protein
MKEFFKINITNKNRLKTIGVCQERTFLFLVGIKSKWFCLHFTQMIPQLPHPFASISIIPYVVCIFFHLIFSLLFSMSSTLFAPIPIAPISKRYSIILLYILKIINRKKDENGLLLSCQRLFQQFRGLIYGPPYGWGIRDWI